MLERDVLLGNKPKEYWLEMLSMSITDPVAREAVFDSIFLTYKEYVKDVFIKDITDDIQDKLVVGIMAISNDKSLGSRIDNRFKHEGSYIDPIGALVSVGINDDLIDTITPAMYLKYEIDSYDYEKDRAIYFSTYLVICAMALTLIRPIPFRLVGEVYVLNLYGMVRYDEETVKLIDRYIKEHAEIVCERNIFNDKPVYTSFNAKTIDRFKLLLSIVEENLRVEGNSIYRFDAELVLDNGRG